MDDLIKKIKDKVSYDLDNTPDNPVDILIGAINFHTAHLSGDKRKALADKYRHEQAYRFFALKVDFKELRKEATSDAQLRRVEFLEHKYFGWLMENIGEPAVSAAMERFFDVCCDVCEPDNITTE